MTAPRISDYALLGDTRSAALVSSYGSIDWWCLPRFDSPPVCGRLLGGEDAGRLGVAPAGSATVAHRGYLPGRPVLRTTWRTDSGTLTSTEGMVSCVAGRLLPPSLLVRRVEAAGGDVAVRVTFAPRSGWSRRRVRLRPAPGGVVADLDGTALALSSSEPLGLGAAETVEVTVRPGRPLTLAVSAASREPLVHVGPDRAWDELTADGARWQRWLQDLPADVPFRDAVERSLLVLRLLTYSPSGAPVAAVTTSLPEAPGGARNWDYRFTWPRDASIAVAGFLALGKTAEASMFLHWLLHASRLDRPRLPALLTLDGNPVPGETVAPGWRGYRGSSPVRVGNDARGQHQLDGYGWFVDAAILYAQAEGGLRGEARRAVFGFADEVAQRWREPDAGIWEERGAPAHHTHSKLMAWLALDRAARLAAGGSSRDRRRAARWRLERDALAADIRARGYDASGGTYTKTYGGTALDASLLLLPLLEFEPAGSPRVSATVDAVRDRLGAGGPFLYRYAPETDGLPGVEGAFLPCSFWLVAALARTGRAEEAAVLMKDLLDVAPLGLFSEEIDPGTRELLGNVPQALTHASLLQAALALRDADDVTGAAGPPPHRRGPG